MKRISSGMGAPRRKPTSWAWTSWERFRCNIEIRTHADGGNPIVEADPDGAACATVYKKIATAVWEKLSGQTLDSPRAAPKIVIQ